MRFKLAITFFVLTTLLVHSQQLPAGSQDQPTKPGSPAAAAQPDHPIVPGFERIHGNPKTTDIQADPVAAGLLLLGELNCTSCHRADDAIAKSIVPKRAPLLDGVGARVQPAFLRSFLANPQHVKPGTTMPNLLAGLAEDERKSNVEALVHFLSASGTVTPALSDINAAKRGEAMFHRIGCVACHAPLRSGTETLSTSVPLGDPAKKYTLNSLTEFLKNPLKTRPSGRMPQLNLNDKEARDIASYFFKDVTIPPNVNFTYYEGTWDKLPDFAKLQPKASGKAPGFNLRVAKRTSNFAIRFNGFLHVAREGEYTFHLGSDDGSRLLIDGKQVVEVDGVHPYQQRSGKLKLTPGPHPIIVDFFQGGGEWRLTLDYQGPGLGRQPAAGAVTMTKEIPKPKDDDNEQLVPDPDLVKQGRKLFAEIGCAACHQLKEGNKPIKSELMELIAQPLKQLKPTGGCLLKTPTKSSPNFHLNAVQRDALQAALKSLPAKPPTGDDLIAQTMTRFNCHACHQRNKVGGVETARNPLFETTIKEMGDEGRIPPHLDGVGDKLTETWLQNVLTNGANDRPYMLTKMPKFGMQNVGHLVKAFIATDAKSTAMIPELTEPTHRVKSAGRHLVGSKALSCIKCHNFGQHKATGIQAIDLTTMTQRLRHDWFHRYMLNPQQYRPGTRMPAVWPFGQATITDVLDGNAEKQLHAVWNYLQDGNKAGVPAGLIRGAIELVPEDTPIIYRNFITGVSPRGIAVGYPEDANLAFDAEQMCLKLIWHNQFIDASKHWNGRGQGFQSPLGDNIITLAGGVPFAALASADSAWPNALARDQGYKFRGYQLNKKGQPTFLYQVRSLNIADFPEPVELDRGPSFTRTITVTPGRVGPIAAKLKNLWYRAAAGSKIEAQDDGWFLVNGALRLHIAIDGSSSKPSVRKLDGSQFELLVPIEMNGDKTRIVQKYVW